MMRTGVLIAAVALSSAVIAQDKTRDITALLADAYGLGYEPSFFQKSRWNCPEGRVVKPTANITRNWVCSRQDPSFYRSVIWRDSDDRRQQVETDNFITMASGRKDYPETSCKESPLALGSGKVTGVIHDCKLPLANGEFYASFAHFKYRDSFLTFAVKNASPQGSTAKVADDLREWLTEIKFN